MALEQHNPASEFDSMLRRHVQQGGVPVAPCAGFDADLASAYLERALNPRASAHFETHLAGCADCRHHVVALARLTALLPETQPEVAAAGAPAAVPSILPVGGTQPVWSRWGAAVSQWLDFSQWNLGWTTAATACGVLLAVIGVRAWQQTSLMSAPSSQLASRGVEASLAETAIARNELRPSDAASQSIDLRQTENHQEQSAALQSNVSEQAAAISAGISKQVPRPVTLPAASLIAGPVAYPSSPSVKVLPPPSLGEMDFGSQPVPPPALNMVSTMGQFGASSPGLAMPVRLNSSAPARPSGPFISLPVEAESKELAAGLVLPQPRERRRAEKNSESVSSLRERDLLNTLKGRASGFMPIGNPSKGDDTRTKEANVKEAQEQPQPLMKRLNGHVFYFDSGFWIDEDYKSEAKLPLKRLVKGTKEYQQAQIENPSLEQFFQLGQVIVVWKGIVYEVRK